MTRHAQTEIYVRFYNKKYDSYGMFEAPCHSVEEAAGQFAEDEDCISAVQLTFNDAGISTAHEDVTASVLRHLENMIDEDCFTRVPHPAVAEYFENWQMRADREAEEQRDHERVEREMLSI
jgi:hypothetical protein